MIRKIERSMFSIKTGITLFLSICLLTACGFHLRGQVKVDSDISKLMLTGGDESFRRELIQAFNLSGIMVDDGAPYQLNIVRVEEDQGQRMKLSAGRYENLLTIRGVYQLETRDGLPLFAPMKLSVERYVSEVSGQGNSAMSQTSMALDEMRGELISSTVRQVSNISNKQLQEEELIARKSREQQLKRSESASESGQS
ncbi:LPS-assembly lipoprotein LptE [invertebrate metagenome]|uniref:LPS-assembly lipoprotein LptE n=1 Tax=invertebrate metagenome TaxID=1711999 RepID=A0A2H9TCI5_9ZZZZ